MTEAHATAHQFTVLNKGAVSALLVRPPDATALFVLAHGAGAGMHHVFMEAIAKRLETRHIATLRYQFPYMEQGSRRPNGKQTLLGTVRAANELADRVAGDLPRIAGGKSMGGRMTSMAAAHAPLPSVQSIVFLGFPLHPAAKPGIERSAHLHEVTVPMHFLQGTRDKLADLDLLRPIVPTLHPCCELHIVDGADHSFHVLKRSGRTHDEVLDQLADTVASIAELRG